MFSRLLLTLDYLIDSKQNNAVLTISVYWFAGYLHLPVLDYTRLQLYEVNLWVFPIAYYRLNIKLCSWNLLSKKKKIRGFQKCKVHCCNFKGFKVTSLQSSTWPGFEPGPPAWVNSPMLNTYAGGPDWSPGQSELWRLVTLKPLKLQQCTLHFWKPLIFSYLDKRGKKRRCMFSP